jgi:hypothetical protein
MNPATMETKPTAVGVGRPSGHVEDARQSGVHRTDREWPLAWGKMYGKGRVFYSSLGHASATWDNPDVYHMYFEAMKALRLTDGDITPRPYPGSAPAGGAPVR